MDWNIKDSEWCRIAGFACIILFCGSAGAHGRAIRPSTTKLMLPSNHAAVTKSKPVAAKKTAKAKAKPFEIKTNPPAGFDMLSAPQSVMATVYANGSLLGYFTVTYTPNYVSFKDPKKIVAKLENITDRKRILHALTGKLAPHTRFICHKDHAKDCRPYFPKVAGVLFDTERYRLDIFVSHRYMKKAP